MHPYAFPPARRTTGTGSNISSVSGSTTSRRVPPHQLQHHHAAAAVAVAAGYSAYNPYPQPYAYPPTYADGLTASTTDLHVDHPAPSHNRSSSAAKPRRPPPSVARSTSTVATAGSGGSRVVRNARPSFEPTSDIWDDSAVMGERRDEDEEDEVEVGRGASERRRGRVADAPRRKSALLAAPAPAPARRRVSEVLRMREQEREGLARRKAAGDGSEGEVVMKKKAARRQTIYVPSEDTTIVTIHPGNAARHRRRERSPDLGLDLVTLSEEEEGTLVSSLKGGAGKAKAGSLAAPPKRAPLRETARTRTLQGVTFAEAVVGRGGGKENVPPGRYRGVAKDDDEDDTCALKPLVKKVTMSTTAKAVPLVETRAKQVNAKPKPNALSSSVERSSPASGSRKRYSTESNSGPSPAKSLKARRDATAAARSVRTSATRSARFSSASAGHTHSPTLSSSPFAPNRSPPKALRRCRPGQHAPKPPSRLSVPYLVQKAREKEEKYPVLTEDLARPELYEDSWLRYQEVALTQLLNGLFRSVDLTGGPDGPDEMEEARALRKKMLALYHEPAVPVLHQRLQASLQYGALSVPKDVLAQQVRLREDVGLRRKFLNLWVRTYDLGLLRAALEAVVGRELPVPDRLSSGSAMAAATAEDGERRERRMRKAIEGFVETFLIRNEDAVRIKTGMGSIASIARARDHREDDFGSQSWSWRRTVLRSLMLVLLLDKVKATDAVPGCLFQISSPYKSSTAVLQALQSMLLPSLGDIMRPLGHVNYQVSCVQYPLQEYRYHVDNLATDLRDGVLLTRLVEVLLYPPTTLMAMTENTVTVTLPSGELLTSAVAVDTKDQWVLSQHLKFPSIGRAQKLYNTQIALSALEGLKGVAGQVVQAVTAEDLVDGHREKTLGLLWGLVGKWGLGALVDWDEVLRETRRFRRRFYAGKSADYQDLDSEDEDELEELDGVERYTFLLRAWARNIGRLRGVRMANLTTAFAGTAAFEAIVDEYMPFCPASSSAATVSTAPLSLPAKLKLFGCSNAFIALFPASHTPHAATIPSRDFTVTTLAFLASRLVPLACSWRAAAVLQRAYRARLARREVGRRFALMRLAHGCAAVVRERDRLTWAATVVQRAWRAVLEDRIRRLVDDVVGFQALARGWRARRVVRERKRVDRAGGRRTWVERVRGGW